MVMMMMMMGVIRIAIECKRWATKVQHKRNAKKIVNMYHAKTIT